VGPGAALPRATDGRREAPSRERQHLLFRDYLRGNPDARDRYADAKRQATSTWGDDRIANTEAEGEPIRRILDEATALGS